MHYVAVATDYNGTVACDGVVDEPTLNARERLRGTNRRLILATGRELPDQQHVMPRLEARRLLHEAIGRRDTLPS